MNKKLKVLLKQGLEAPSPVRKEAFLHRAPAPPVSTLSFLCTQAAYIRKWVWALSAVLFFIAIVGAGVLKKDILWTISAFMPMLALSLLTESSRSERYGMAEFEQASRFSLKSIVLARLGILGLENLVLLCLLVPFSFRNSGFGLLQTGIYLTCPYLLTSFLGVGVLRKSCGREAGYLSVSIAFFVSIGNLLLRQICPVFYESSALGGWLVAETVFAIGAAYQYYQIIRQKEELTWNL